MGEGTELYIVLEGLQDSKLLGFLVGEFQELKPWDSDVLLKKKLGHYVL